MTGDTTVTTQKEAVLLVGSGYGALKVAEDLAQSGIPVVWVTRAAHFLKLPGGIESFHEWPEDINFQFRPLYLRVTRHPLVTPVTGARIETLEHAQDGYRTVVVQDPQYIDYDLCTGCGRCVEVCPLQHMPDPPLTRSPAYCPSRALELDKRKLSACRVSCPLGINVQAYMALAAASRFDEALHVIKEDNPLPGICGRVCHHPCEESCRRGELDQTLAIRDVKRFLADHEARKMGPVKLDMPERPRRPERVAVIGSGPAGLTAAHFLNRAGFPVTIFEALPLAGGMLRAGINTFRLPRAVLETEIQAIANAGVEIRTGVKIRSLDDLAGQDLRAVLLCTGTHRDLRLNIPGEGLDGVVHCVEFLRGINLHNTGEVGARTVVIGAGNSAMDAARTALRLGAKEVTILAIETEDEMPAHPREVREAAEEGVQFNLGAAPIAFEGDGQRVRRIVCRPARWSEPDPEGICRIEYDSDRTFTLEADTVIVSIGQRPHLEETRLADELNTGSGGKIIVDEASSTSRPGVFAAGDVVTGPSTVIDSMAAGRRAAGRIIECLTGEPPSFVELTAESRGVGDYVEISEDVPRQWRPEMAQRQPKARRRDFEEVDFGFTADQAVAESRRCLQCSACCECQVCETVCTDIGAIDHFRPTRRLEFMSPGVIVADPDELPGVDAIKHEGIYRLGDFKSAIDFINVMVDGSAAAGQAMAQAASLRVSAFPEEPEPLEPEDGGQLGFFVCTCNGAMAPDGVIKRIREMAARVPSVAHSESIFSACHPRGSDHIARTVREKHLSRVILASCVCCPLEFQCISCNDQRTRARIHLFDRLGLPRSRFETINIKDHLVTEDGSEDEIFERARYLLRDAFVRAHLMGPLRQGITKIGSNIIILGGSEVGVSC
ncbi:MAG: FAD-dependent oxidoreductase, partial [Candidatus Hydrogenedentota bacterium]